MTAIILSRDPAERRDNISTDGASVQMSAVKQTRGRGDIGKCTDGQVDNTHQRGEYEGNRIERCSPDIALGNGTTPTDDLVHGRGNSESSSSSSSSLNF